MKEALIAGVTAIIVACIQFIIFPLLTKTDVEDIIKDNSAIWKTFPEIVSGTDKTEYLGKWDICALTIVGANQHTQACTCALKPDDGTWKIYLESDDSRPDLTCRCQASCVDFQKPNKPNQKS